MHWIEQLWHVDPDNGSGTLEAALLLAPMVGVVVAALARRGRRARARVRR
jgi:hypothetical protein